MKNGYARLSSSIKFSEIAILATVVRALKVHLLNKLQEKYKKLNVNNSCPGCPTNNVQRFGM